MAETITKQQQEAFIPSVIHNPNPSSQAICPPTGRDWKCDMSQAYGPNCHILFIQYLFIILSDLYFLLAVWQIVFNMKYLDWYTVQCALNSECAKPCLLVYSCITFILRASKQNCSFWRKGKSFGGRTAVKLNVGGCTNTHQEMAESEQSKPTGNDFWS